MVSIIVPVYNCEKYLEECVCSLVNQSYRELQIILINDGSKDKSGEICKRWSEKESRIELINQENKGVSAARNVGLARAEGEFVCFVDADDYLPLDSISNRVQNIEKYSLCVTNYSIENDLLEKTKIINPGVVTAEEYKRMLFDVNVIGYQGYLWNKLFRMDIIKKNRILFNERISYNEDRLFVFHYLMHVNTVKICNIMTYTYRINSNGAMGEVLKGKYTEKMFSELLAFDEMLYAEKDKKIKNYISRDAFHKAIMLQKMLTKTQEGWADIRLKMKSYMKSYCDYSIRGIYKKTKMCIIYFLAIYLQN